MTKININLRDGRPDPATRSWVLPRHSHPINAGVFLLLKQVGETYLPIGSAFALGNFRRLFVTAAHVVDEAVRDDPILQRRAKPLQGSAQLNVPLFVCLIQHQNDHVRLTFMPITQAVGFPPTDAMVLVTAEDPPIPMLNQRIGFDFPRIGQTVFSIGFASSGATPVGITRGDVESRKFDWDAAFQATLSVAEGRVTRLFPSGHSGFLKAPCFEFDGPMVPGMSGGPIMTEDGLIIGINSADASLFQGPGETGASLGSPLSPLLFGTTKIPLIQGPMTIRFELGILDLIGHGAIATDGSEETVWFDRDSYGQLILCSRVDRDDLPASYESLAKALENFPVQEGSGIASGFTLKRVRT